MSTTDPSPPRRVSYEVPLLGALRESVADLRVMSYSGQGRANKFGISDWNLPANQHFQFGDLRVELPSATVVVETESAGGVGNLVKYWPLLQQGIQTKPLVLFHVYMLGSSGDYIAHRTLWSFLLERMTEDLKARGIVRPDQWDAELATYPKGGSTADVAASFRRLVLEAMG
jgi:hypothetical protein